jgi:hypothetical protein
MREMTIRRWLKHLLGSRSLDADLNDEVCFHLRMRAESYMLAGKSEEDAMELARRQFGDIEAVKRAMRGARRHPRYALSAGLMGLVIIVVGLWLYDSSRSSELPNLPPGMKFVSGPPPAP